MITTINLEREGTNSNRYYPNIRTLSGQNYDRVKLIDTEQGIHTSIELYIPIEKFSGIYQ